MKSGAIPKATVARLPLYLHALESLATAGAHKVSSERLASSINVNAANVRKDLSYLGSYGVRGVGYSIRELSLEIRSALGLTRDFGIVIVGVGNMGSALAKYDGFTAAGYYLVGLYDNDPKKIGTLTAGHTIKPIDDMKADLTDRSAEIGIITTPANAAQDVADQMAEVGVRSILNFAQTVLKVETINVRRVDLATELRILSYYLQTNPR